jgi:hypothetical protein
MIKYTTIMKNQTLEGYIKKECNCGGIEGDHANDCPVNN